MRYITYIILLALAQGLLFNNIHIMGIATPLMYVWFVLMLPRDLPHWKRLVMCFVLGTLIDTFSNTAGLAMTSLTAVGFVQPYFLELFLGREDEEDFKPSIRTMGFWKYSFYAFCLVALYCLIYFGLDAFTLQDLIYLLMVAGSSGLITYILILIIGVI